MMNYSFTGYMIASAIVLILSVIAYLLLLEGKVRPSYNRWILLSIYPISFLIPLLIGLWPESQVDAGVEIGTPEFAGVVGNNINGDSQRMTIEIYDILKWISGIYFIGLLLTALFSLMTIGHLIFLLIKSKKMAIDDIEVYVHTNEKLSSFSWCNQIFLFEGALNSELKDLQMLVSHEKTHLDKGHWIDLGFAQIVLIFQWFNPAAWYMRSELQRIHEYEADESVLKTGIQEKDYQMLLIQNISGNRYSGLTDGLNNCSLKKRIIMMKKTKFKKDWVTRGIAVCGFAVLGGLIIHIPAVAFVLEEGKPMVNSPTSKETNNLNFAQEDLNSGENNDTAPLYYVNGERVKKEDLASVNPDNIKGIVVDKSSENPKVEITTKEVKQPVEYNTTESYNDSDKKKGVIKSYPDAYLEVDKVAEYIGGQSQLLKDLSETMVYPEEAKEKGIEGRVVVRFQINTNGTLSNCEVAHSQNALLDDAALKAVEDLPGKWEPAEVNGKPVASIFNMPVTFKLQYPQKN
ncbi:MAG: M56 family metallopeptidase [Muribaculaceae bacterium]|nr:M56 family metallopeptidase [Muribaculaceae bacterium]